MPYLFWGSITQEQGKGMFKQLSPLPVYKEIMARIVDVLKLLASKRQWWMTEARHLEEMPGLDHKLNIRLRKKSLRPSCDAENKRWELSCIFFFFMLHM